ncbi:MAG TPA: autotransporter-associated beta strand repeat-containing protein, partial [Lacunisphaera sp.]|nr:autotransporter-associated beta strand repeat-containing protein [Lacunisphaera sp.]
MRSPAPNPETFPRLAARGLGRGLVFALALAGAVLHAQRPEGGTVVAGAATIANAANSTVVTAGNNSVLRWSSFNVGADHTVQFVQPGASARVLNWIGGLTPSQIDGALLANGRVYLLNPQGVYFGRTAVVDVAGLYAIGGSMTKEDFLTGMDRFSVTGDVRNAGSIRGDFVALVGRSVANTGSIVSPGGFIGLASGDRVYLGQNGGNIYVDAGPSASAATPAAGTGVANSGSIDAGRGQAVLAAGDLYSVAIAHDGRLAGRDVQLQGQGKGDVLVSGRIDASAHSAGDTGGHVEVTGERVGLVGSAAINASGPAGGGTILVGGDLHGANAAVRNASQTFVGPTATLNADATQSGNGGKVVVWSDNTTRFFGGISARGGQAGGDGGAAEVSGKQNLTFAGTADLDALRGVGGSLLLDPDDLYVGVDPNPGVTATQDTTDPFQATDGVNNYFVLASAFSGNTSYTLAANHDVIFNAGVTFGTAGGNTVSVTATNAITSTGFTVATSGGNLTLNSATMALGAIDTGSGLLTINNSGAATQSGVFAGSGGLTKTGSGALTLDQANTYTGGTSINQGTLILNNNSGVSSGSLTLANGTTLTGSLGQNRILSNSVVLTSGTATIHVPFSGGDDFTFNGVISGAGGLNITSDFSGRSVTLNSANSFLGGVTLDGTGGTYPTLAISNAGALGAGTLTSKIPVANPTGGLFVINGNLSAGGGVTNAIVINSGSRLSVSTTSAAELSGVISGTGSFSKLGTGTVTLSGTNTYGGATTISGGVLSVSSLANIGSNGNIGTGDNTSAATNAASLVLDGGTLQYTGAGETTDRLFTLTTNGGTIDTSGTGALSFTNTGAVAFSGTSARTLTLTGTNTGANTLAPVIGDNTGATSLTKSGTGTWKLSGANTYTGATNLNGGTLSIGADANLGAAPGAATPGQLGFDGGTLETTASFTLAANRGIALNTGGGTIQVDSAIATTYGGIAAGSGALTKSGTGTLTLAGANTYTGATTVNGGTLKAGTSGAFGNNSAMTLANTAGVALDLNGFDTQVGSLTGGGATGGNVTLGLATLTVGGDNSSPAAYAGVISGSGGLTKIGTGTLTLSRTNSYTGATTVNGGTLSLASTGALGSSSGTTVASGATLDVGFSSGTLGNTSAITLNGAGVGSAGALTFSGTTATLNNAITLAGNSTIGGSGSGTLAGIVSGGFALTKAGSGTLTLSGANTYTGATTVTSGTLNLSGSLASSSVSVGNGAVYQLTGVSSSVPVTLNNGATLRGSGTATQSGSVTLSGAAQTIDTFAAADALTVSGAVADAGSSTLTLAGVDNSSIGFTSSVTTNGLTVSGTSQALSFTGTSGTITGTVNFANTGSLTLGRNDGTGTLTFTGGLDATAPSGVTLGGTIDATGATQVYGPVTLGANTTLKASTATFDGTVAGASHNLQVTGAAVFGNDTSDIVTGIGTLAVSGATTINTTTITTTGTQAYTGAVTVGTDASLSTTNSDVTFGSTIDSAASQANDLSVGIGTGTLSLGGAVGGGVNGKLGALTLTIGSSLALPAVTADSLQLSAAGAITQTGDLTITNLANFKTLNDTGAAITLSSDTNAFGSVGAQVLATDNTSAAAANISIHETGGTVVAGLRTGGNVSLVTNGGALTQTGSIVAGGTTSVSAGAAPITLDDAGNDFTGAVALANSGANDVVIKDANALVLGNIAVGTGALTITANTGGTPDTSGISQFTATTITQGATAGTATFSSGAGAITLNNTSNDFTGSVALSNSGTNDVTIRDDSGGLQLDQVNVGRDLTVKSTGGNISLKTGSTLVVPGILRLDAGTDDILLDENNNLHRVVVEAGDNVTIGDIAGLLFGDNSGTATGASTVSGNLTVHSSGGAVGQTEELAVGGTTSIDAGANAITLTNTANDFTGAVSLTNTGGNNVAITDANALDFGTTSLGSGTLTVTATGITQTGGAITQAASAGAVTFNGGAAAIDLTNSSNDFTGAVSLNNSGANNVAITDTNALIVGTSSVGNDLALTAGGDITQTGAITAIGGVMTVAVTAAGSDILLGTQANDFGTSAPAFGGTQANIRDVSLRNINGSAAMPDFSGLSNLRSLILYFDANGITLPALTLASGGNLSVTAGGNITQGGALVVPGTASFSAGSNAITLTNGSNDFTGAVSLTNTSGNVAVTDLNAIVLGNVSVGTGTLDVTAVGITQASSTAITQASAAGAATFDGGAGAIDLTNSGNDFTGTVNLANSGANDIAITDTNGLTLGSLTLGQNLSVTSAALDLQQDVNAGSNTVTLTHSGALTQAASKTITAATLNLNGVGAVGATGAGNEIRTDVTTINFNKTTGAGDSFLGEAGDITLTGSTAGAVDLTSPGTVTLSNFTASGGFTSDAALAVSGTISGPMTFTNDLTLTGITTFGSTVSLGKTGGLAFDAGGFAATFNGALTLTSDTTVTGGAGALTFNAGIDGAHGLTINAGAGGVKLLGGVGATTPLSSLAVTGTATVGGTIKTNGNTQNWGNLILASSTTFTDPTGNINFNGTVDATTAGVEGLTATASAGAVTFAQNVGFGTALGAVNVTATGINLNGANLITENGQVDLTGPVTLGAVVSIDATHGGAGAGANINFNTASTTVDATTIGTETLTLNAGTGTVTVGGNVGATKTLGALTITNAGTTLFSGTLDLANALTQTNAATGTTTFANTVSVGSADLKGVAYNLNNSFASAGTTSFTNSGTLTKNSTGNITSTGAFSTTGDV